MSNLAGGRLFTRSELNKLDFFASFWGNAKKKKLPSFQNPPNGTTVLNQKKNVKQ